ncbi:MAG: DUF4476 domain-containing protein [Myxococcales bacterium]|nr:DUF4476 domain-containing protein [Myxococcales bacterium]
MKRLTLGLLCCACATAAPPPPAVKEKPAPAAEPMPAPVVDEKVAVEYRPQSEGSTLVEVLSPPGARVDVREGQALVGRDVAPMTVKGEADHWYVVAARLPSGALRETKVQARAGQVASVHFAEAAPQGPQAMSREAFKDFVHNVDMEAGDEAKLNLIHSAASHEWFTAAMAGVLIDHIVHRENKLAAVPILKDRILDRENAFWLYQHFTYREDKAKVQEMLEH